MTDTENKTVRDRLLEWLFQQGVSTVLLVAILSTLAYFGNYEQRVAIPQRIRDIQAGYDRNLEVHRRIEAAQRESFKEALQLLIADRP